MAQAAGDPEELERFAHSLQQFIDSLNDAVGNLNGAFASLGDTWQDEKRARFEEDYNALVQQLRQFLLDPRVTSRGHVVLDGRRRFRLCRGLRWSGHGAKCSENGTPQPW